MKLDVENLLYSGLHIEAHLSWFHVGLGDGKDWIQDLP